MNQVEYIWPYTYSELTTYSKNDKYMGKGKTLSLETFLSLADVESMKYLLPYIKETVKKRSKPRYDD